MGHFARRAGESGQGISGGFVWEYHKADQGFDQGKGIVYKVLVSYHFLRNFGGIVGLELDFFHRKMDVPQGATLHVSQRSLLSDISHYCSEVLCS